MEPASGRRFDSVTATRLSLLSSASVDVVEARRRRGQALPARPLAGARPPRPSSFFRPRGEEPRRSGLRTHRSARASGVAVERAPSPLNPLCRDRPEAAGETAGCRPRSSSWPRWRAITTSAGPALRAPAPLTERAHARPSEHQPQGQQRAIRTFSLDRPSTSGPHALEPRSKVLVRSLRAGRTDPSPGRSIRRGRGASCARSPPGALRARRRHAVNKRG